MDHESYAGEHEIDDGGSFVVVVFHYVAVDDCLTELVMTVVVSLVFGISMAMSVSALFWR